MSDNDREARAGRQAVRHWLEDMCTAVRDIEREAADALHDKEDETAYREAMRRKALLLASLPDRGRDAVSLLPPQDRTPVEERLHRFAASAANALSIGSVFYMSALLYPEDHAPGKPNDLERFAASFTEPA